jgi:hypothetical protein
MIHRRHGCLWLGGLVALIALATGCEKLPNIPPTAVFIVSPVSPIIAGRTQVTFNATGSQDSDGQIARYQWDFGDGTQPEASSTPVTTHVFPRRGGGCVETTYTVLLAVVDDSGDTTTASQTVTVTDPACAGG